jgi:hypothetical protein
MKHNCYANCRMELTVEIAISLPALSCLKGMVSYPELAINHSVVHLFIVPKMRFLSPDDAIFD